MIGEDPKAMFSYHVDFRHFIAVSRDTRFTYWLCDCLDHLEGVLKKADIYEAISASLYKQQIDEEHVKALMARLSPRTNNILKCYAELDISLCDVYRITRLPIVGEMYDGFLLTNILILNKKLPTSF